MAGQSEGSPWVILLQLFWHYLHWGVKQEMPQPLTSIN